LYDSIEVGSSPSFSAFRFSLICFFISGSAICLINGFKVTLFAEKVFKNPVNTVSSPVITLDHNFNNLDIVVIAKGVQFTPLPATDSTGLKSRVDASNIDSASAKDALASPYYIVWSSL